MNRLDTVTQGESPTASTTDYEYTSIGQLQSVTTRANSTANQLVTSYTYRPGTDGENQVADGGMIASVDDPLAPGTHTNPTTTYSYDDFGRLEDREDPARLKTHLTYEAATGRLDAMSVTKLTDSSTVASYDPTYDKAGNIAEMTQQVAAPVTSSGPSVTGYSGTWNYALDEAGRMTQATQTGGPGGNATYTYRYDGGGNRTFKQLNTQTATATTYDGAGLPTTETGASTKTYCYDSAGNLRKRYEPGANDDCGETVLATDYAYEYDTWGRTTSADVGGAEIDYTVDALGRTIKRSGAVTTDYTFQGLTEQIATLNEGGAATSFAYTASGSPLAQKGATEASLRFFVKNLHGDVVSTASAPGATSGVAQSAVDYSPFGERENQVGEAQPKLGFQGQLHDADTKLVDTKTRMYDPSMGRFTSMDTVFGEIKSPVSLNQYGYGNGNPVTMTDPSGMTATYSTYSSYQYALSIWTSLRAYFSPAQLLYARPVYVPPPPPPPPPAPAGNVGPSGPVRSGSGWQISGKAAMRISGWHGIGGASICCPYASAWATAGNNTNVNGDRLERTFPGTGETVSLRLDGGSGFLEAVRAMEYASESAGQRPGKFFTTESGVPGFYQGWSGAAFPGELSGGTWTGKNSGFHLQVTNPRTESASLDDPAVRLYSVRGERSRSEKPFVMRVAVYGGMSQDCSEACVGGTPTSSGVFSSPSQAGHFSTGTGWWPEMNEYATDLVPQIT